ncbi:MAG: hypothetical protein QM612_02710 [Thermomonas sp.]|uniref:hypothetical protein n=1 Tax=Thermomonas sp. TaxID=1971895 RepID=UPI0039E6FFEF
MHKQSFFLLLASLAAPALASDPPQIAAEQVMHDFNTGGFVLGPHGNANFRFAQTFQLPAAGEISHIMLPIACSTATTVRVKILQVLRSGFPSSVALIQQDVPASAMNAWTASNGMQSMRMVEFARPRIFSAGSYAFSIEAIGGECVLWPGPSGNSYDGGEAFIINGVSVTSWLIWSGRDLAFQVFQRPL